jgi:hypothetical protein
MKSRPRMTLCLMILTTVIALAVAGLAAAQRRGLLSAAPTLDPVVPLGGQRGTAVDLTISGTNLSDPLAVWTSWAAAPLRVTLPAGSAPRKDSTVLPVKVELTADVPLGWHRVRVATAHGLTNARPFCIDALPQLNESNDNHAPATAQPVTVPCVIVGRADPEQSDFFKFTVIAGQRLTFDVLARRLGSAFDPVIRLHDLAAGRDIPAALSDDAPGLQTDARLTHTFAAAGDYAVEIRDTTHKGGKDYWYRLRIGDFPCALAPLPLAAKRGATVTVHFAEDVRGQPANQLAAPVTLTAPTDPALDCVSLVPVGPNGVPGWPVELLLSDHDELLSQGNQQTPAEAMRLMPPSGVTGRFQRRSQKDHYVFTAKKGQALQVIAQTADVHSPADVLLTLMDAKAAVVARSNPDVATAAIEFTPPADGDYTVVAEHLNYAFGPTEFYRLVVRPRLPSFELAVTTDRLDIPQGQLALLPLQQLTRHGFGGPIEVSVVGPAGLSGTVTVPENAQSPPPAAGQPEPPAAALLPVRAGVDLAPGPYEIKMRARAMIDGKEFITFASTRPAVSRDLGNLAVPPRVWQRTVGVGVTPKPPFTLTARWDRPEAVRGLSTKLVVTATRDAGFDGDIALTVNDLPADVTAAPQKVAKDQTETTIDVQLKEQAPLGTFAFSVVGRSQHQGHESAAIVLPPPLVVALPFDLAVTPNPLTLTAGEKAKLAVRTTRKGGYDGPVALEFRNLPASVTVPKAAIAKGQDQIEVELTAAANAALGARGDVSVLGTAPLGNQQAASPNFTVRVQPPPPQLTLKAEPAALTLKSGAKAAVRVTIDRKHLTGPAALSVEGLPDKITAAPVQIAADKNEATIEFIAAADAAPAKADATIKAQIGMTVATTKVTVQVEKPAAE